LSLYIFKLLKVSRAKGFQISDQKKHIENKQKEILDSIHYAKRIQSAMLSSEKNIERTLKRLKG